MPSRSHSIRFDPSAASSYLLHMLTLTSEHIARLYSTYSDTEITFNTQVMFASGLLPADIRLRLGDEELPCILHACSMKGARVVAEVEGKRLDQLSKSLVALRLAFRPKDAPSPTTFFIFSRVESLTEYNAQRPSLRFITLQFSQRPADMLIGILGSLLEINANAVRRRNERIAITSENMKRIGLESKESCVAIDGMPRNCILSDISFGGAKVLVTGVQDPGKKRGKVLLKLGRCEMKEDAVMDGSIVRVEEVDGEGNTVSLSIQFVSDPPLSYKQKINDYFSGIGKAG